MRLDVGAPCEERQLRALEGRIGVPLPESFREVLLRFSGEVDFGWQFAEGTGWLR